MTTSALTEATSAEAAKAASRRYGVLAGLVANCIWGLFPLYWPLLEPASPFEILAHRVTWSLLVCIVLVAATGAWVKVRAVLRSRRQVLLLLAASALITVNWGVYIWAATNKDVVEASLGYFINPLLSVVMGVVLLRERLRRLQWVAVGIATAAVVMLTVGYGRLPWIALVLALSFSTYGMCKKLAGVESVPSLAIETAFSFPFAITYLVILSVHGTLTFGHSSISNTLLLAGAGVVTVLPLLAFNAAAIRIPLSVLGLMQYLTPVLQFTLGVIVFGEVLPPARWIGFAIVWVALGVFTADAIRDSRRLRVSAAS